jgi:hypothetical protein
MELMRFKKNDILEVLQFGILNLECGLFMFGLVRLFFKEDFVGSC